MCATATKSATKPKPKIKTKKSQLAQVEANRRNAKKSTGPRTADGKSRSRFNALKHGMTAQIVLLPKSWIRSWVGSVGSGRCSRRSPSPIMPRPPSGWRLRSAQKGTGDDDISCCMSGWSIAGSTRSSRRRNRAQDCCRRPLASPTQAENRHP